MKLSDRMKQSRTAADADAPTFGTVTTRATTAAEAKAPTADDPVTQLKWRAQEALIIRMGPALWDPSVPVSQLDSQVARELGAVLKEEKIPLNDAERDQLVSEIIDSALGYGPIERYLDDPSVSEVMVNGLDGVFVEREGQLIETDAQFFSEQHVLRVIDRIVAPLGRRIDEASPMVDARLPDGSRVNAVIAPLAIDGPQLTIRKFTQRVLSLDDLVRLGTLTDQVARVPVRVRQGSHEHPHQRRDRQRQDDAAQRAVVDDPRDRTHRHDRGRRRAAPAAAARRSAREPNREHRRQG